MVNITNMVEPGVMNVIDVSAIMGMLHALKYGVVRKFAILRTQQKLMNATADQ